MGKYDSIIITLYKGRYERSNEHAIQYRTFGEFDYIQISDVPICTDEDDVNYYKLWQKTEEISRELNVAESCHNLYAFATQTDRTEEFWEDQKPYIFVSLLQFKTDLDGRIKEKATELERYLNTKSDQRQKFNYTVYYSLDSCDFVIFIKANAYETGAEQVQSFSVFSDRDRENNSYSYSICGIDFQELLNQEEEEIFEKVMICFVVKQVSAYQKWYGRFSKIFPQIEQREVKENTHFNYNRLGNEDVCINIMLCNIRELVQQMQEGGCLWTGDEDFCKGVMKLRIHFDTNPYIDRLSMQPADGETDPEPEGGSYINMYRENVSREAKEQLYPFVKKALEEVLRSCSYLEEEDFARDVRKCTRASIAMLFDKMNEFWMEDPDETVGRDIVKNQIDYNNSVVMVVQGIMSIVNGSLHTDRMFFQSPGFNAVLYDIPVKMLAFYNNFVQMLVHVLNDHSEEKKFCYLLCPDLYLSIKIKKLFDNKYEYPRQRFLLGTIPVKAIFEPKRLMQELVHEVAHCVGDCIRLRSQRWRYTVAMYAETIATSMLAASDHDSDMISVLGNIYDKLGDQNRNKLHKDLTEKIKQYLSEKFIPVAERTEFDYYQIKTVNFFEVHVIELLSEHMDQLLETMESVIKKSYKESNRPVLEYVSDMSKFIGSVHNNVNMIFRNLHSINSSIHRLTNESFADLVMCETLGIDMDEYVELFYNAHNEEIKDPSSSFLNYSKNVTAERIVSVVRCYGKKIKELNYNAEDQNYCLYRQKLMVYSEECAQSGSEKKQVILPPAVIRNNIKYLQECRQEIVKKHEQLQELQKIYKSVISKEVSQSILTFLEI